MALVGKEFKREYGKLYYAFFICGYFDKRQCLHIYKVCVINPVCE